MLCAKGVFVVNSNLARRPRPTRPQSSPEPRPHPCEGLEIGRASHAAPLRVLEAFFLESAVRPEDPL